MIRLWVIMIRFGDSWAHFAMHGGLIVGYRTRSEAKEDLAAARKQCGRRSVRLISFVMEERA